MRHLHNIERINNCSSLEEAVSRLINDLSIHRDVYQQVHKVSIKQGFPLHKHHTTNEWIVIFNASIDMLIMESGLLKAERISSFEKAIAIKVPKGTCHTIRNQSPYPIVYATIKDGPDDFDLC